MSLQSTKPCLLKNFPLSDQLLKANGLFKCRETSESTNIIELEIPSRFQAYLHRFNFFSP